MKKERMIEFHTHIWKQIVFGIRVEFDSFFKAIDIEFLCFTFEIVLYEREVDSDGNR